MGNIESASGLVPLSRDQKSDKPIIARTLRERDAFLLEYYFGEGKTVFSRSTFGATLTRADLYRHGTYPCYVCQDFAGVNPTTGDWCKRCRGTGFFSFELYASKGGALTALPSKAAAEASGYEPNHQALQIFGKVGRRLDIVAERGGRQFPRVLELVLGDAGALFARTRYGRIFGAYSETAAGRRLVARARDDGAYIQITPTESLCVQLELQKTQPKKWRRDLIEQTIEQATELYGDAVQAWNLSAFFVRASKTPMPPVSKHSYEPPAARRSAKETVEYVEAFQEQCRSCSKMVPLPELFCARCKAALNPSELVEAHDHERQRVSLRMPVETVAGAE